MKLNQNMLERENRRYQNSTHARDWYSCRWSVSDHCTKNNLWSMQQWKANTTKVLANLKKNVQIWKLNQFTCSSTNPSFCISNISHVTLYAIFQRLQLEYSLFLYLTALSHQRTVFSFFSPVFNPLPTQAFSVVFPLPQHDSFLSTCLR